MVQEIGKVVANLNQGEGLSMLFVEQNARPGLQLSRRCYILGTGSIALDGDIKALVDNECVKRVYPGIQDSL